MPKYQHRIDQHRLFLVEERGDTLIVFPKGDPAGFANLNFNIEHAAVLALLKNGKQKNVLVDLSASNYFGAKILGAFSEWADVVKAKEGKFALCELSSDMKELLHIFQFDEQWQQFETREEAVKEIVTETPLEVVQSHWKSLACLFVAVLFLAAWYSPWQQYYARYVNQRDYETVLAIWEKMQSLTESNASPAEWRKLQNRAHRELAPIVPELGKRAGTQSPQARIAQELLFATRDNILKHLLVKTDRLQLYEPTGPKKEYFWEMTAMHMEKARLLMNGQDASHVKIPSVSAPAKSVKSDVEVPEAGDDGDPSPAIAEPSRTRSRTRPKHPDPPEIP